MRQISRIRKEGEKIIADSFPLLKGKKIVYLVVYLRFFAFSAWIPPILRIIVVSTRAKKMNDSALTGILAHELCHQERYIKMGLVNYLKFIFEYTLSPHVRREEERATDTLTIEKGYARELYDLTLISGADKNHSGIIDNYLTPEEIKDYALKTGKWRSDS